MTWWYFNTPSDSGEVYSSKTHYKYLNSNFSQYLSLKTILESWLGQNLDLSLTKNPKLRLKS